MRRSRKGTGEVVHHINHTGIPDQRPGFFTGILFTVLLILGVLFWYFLFDLGTPDASKILVVEIVVLFISLAINVLMICKAGYNTFSQNFGVTYILNILGSVIGLYIAGVQLVENVNGSPMIEFWRFVLFVIIAALMALMPTIVICAVMWLIMSIFGTYR